MYFSCLASAGRWAGFSLLAASTLSAARQAHGIQHTSITPHHRTPVCIASPFADYRFENAIWRIITWNGGVRMAPERLPTRLVALENARFCARVCAAHRRRRD